MRQNLRIFQTKCNTYYNYNRFWHRTINMNAIKIANKAIVAISQIRSTNNKVENLRIVKECVEKAKKQNASILFLPECCDFVGTHKQETIELSEPLTGTLMQQYQQLARDFNMWLSLGGIHETIILDNEPTNQIHNTHVLLNNTGQIVSVYRKLHLFDVDTEEFRFRESEVVKPGTTLVPPVATPAGILGLQICYDMRFAEASLLLRKAGAQLLTYPSAFAHSTGKAHWSILLQSRAIENQCFVLAAAQIGWHNKKRLSWGHALAIDPWGGILADCGTQENCVKSVEIDLQHVAHVRSIMPCFEHRRDDMYNLQALSFGQDVKIEQDFKFSEHTIDNSTVFYESTHCFAFTNIRCVVEGHVLVATKRITARLQGLNHDELSDLFVTVCRIQRMLEAYYGTKAATVTVQDGAEAGQTVPHVHFHLMPRRPNDFRENDEIYVKLEDQCKSQCADRTLEERINEAQIYKKCLQSCD